MNAVFLFLLKSILVSGILTGYYWVALRNKQFHQYNRFYLLFTLYASIHLPLLQVDWITLYQFEHVIVNTPLKVAEQVEDPVHLEMVEIVIPVCCLIVSIFLLSVLIRRIIYILKLKRRYPLDKVDGVSLVYTDLPKAPFSFLNNLFWRDDIPLTSQSGKQVFQHELAHIKQKHTYDKVISQVMVCIGWFNPFYWLLQKEMNMIHEFLADQQAIKDGDTESFARMLLQVHNGGHYLDPGHQFSYSPISRRLSMIIRSKKTSFPYLRKLVLFPLLFLIVASFTVKKITIEVGKPRFNYFINRTDTVAPRLPLAPRKSRPALEKKPAKPKQDRVPRVSRLPANTVNSADSVPAGARPKEPALPAPSAKKIQTAIGKSPGGVAVDPVQPIKIETGKKPPGEYDRKGSIIPVQEDINELLKRKQREQRDIRIEAQHEKEQDKRNDRDQRKALQKRDASFDIKNDRFKIKNTSLKGVDDFFKTKGDPFKHTDELLKIVGEHRKMEGEMKHQEDELRNQGNDLWKQRDEPWKHRVEQWKLQNGKVPIGAYKPKIPV